MTEQEWLDHYLSQAPYLPDEAVDHVLAIYQLERV
jgi:hypothetical protein